MGNPWEVLGKSLESPWEVPGKSLGSSPSSREILLVGVGVSLIDSGPSSRAILIDGGVGSVARDLIIVVARFPGTR